MGRRRRDRKQSSQKYNLIRIQREMKKMDAQFLIPTQQR
jgi:hypothetical protein